jgi:hypothetical protein
MNNGGYIYIAQESNSNYFKIGKTKRDPIKNRLSELQSGNKNPIRIIMIYKIDNIDFYEKLIHKKLDKYRIKNGGGREWFYFPNNILIDEILSIIGKILPSNMEPILNDNTLPFFIKYIQNYNIE